MKRSILYGTILMMMTGFLFCAKKTTVFGNDLPKESQNLTEVQRTVADENEETTEEEPETTALPKKIRNFKQRKTAITSITLISKRKIKLQWDKVAGANGYILYKKTNDGKNKKLAVIKKKKTVTYSDKKVKYGDSYTYKIKAYKEYDGKTYYSKYQKEGYQKVFKVKKKKIAGYHYLYDMDNQMIENIEAFLDNPSYCLKVNLLASVMTVYAKDGTKDYTIPLKAYLCSGNIYDTCGTYSLGVKYRFRSLYYNCYSQWASRIFGDILFHTVPYTQSQNPNSLDVKQYNLLGQAASHGCIRLQCVASKWINDHCPSGIRVVFYKSQNPGPLGKPYLEKMKSWHTWNPTDPTMQYKCKEHNCKHKTV